MRGLRILLITVIDINSAKLKERERAGESVKKKIKKIKEYIEIMAKFCYL